jgi:glycine betaine/proline transport system substrate-binding protein
MNSAVKDGKTMDQAVKDWTDSHADLIKRWENIKKS